MDLFAVLDQVRAQLLRNGRLSYRLLQLQFDLDDEQLGVLKEELIDIQGVAVDRDGKMLVWIGKGNSVRLTSCLEVQANAAVQHER